MWSSTVTRPSVASAMASQIRRSASDAMESVGCWFPNFKTMGSNELGSALCELSLSPDDPQATSEKLIAAAMARENAFFNISSVLLSFEPSLLIPFNNARHFHKTGSPGTL